MIKEFKYYETINLEGMTNTVTQMQEILEKLANNEIPNVDYSLEKLVCFCSSLVENQRNEMSSVKKGSWSVGPDERMPSDARVDFVFFPTYIAVAILSKFMQLYPAEAKLILDFKKVISRGLFFSTYRRLLGHGYDATKDMIKAIEILDMGDVPKLLVTERELSFELFMLLRDIKFRVDGYLDQGNVTAGWEQDFTEEYKTVSKILDSVVLKYEVILDDVAEVIRAPYGLKNTQTNPSHKEYAAIRVSNLNKNRTISSPDKTVFYSENMYERFKLQAEDILLSGFQNKIALISSDYDNDWVAAGPMFIIRLKQNNKIKTAVVLMWLLELLSKDNVFVEKDNERHRMPTLSKIRGVVLNIPTPEKQKDIIDVQKKIDLINEEVIKLTEKINLLEGNIVNDLLKKAEPLSQNTLFPEL